ncbi:uncharacterized protein LOC114946371 [Nylanderia fulva]|uniref:uncharacterized protein LOC114946371 n=1 Tax=Nylanderia fulva TaxID=613905 RepID=UPI0010FB136E|nr:uncharacterized protein LOC114946371 [Nylanderia fulva]
MWSYKREAKMLKIFYYPPVEDSEKTKRVTVKVHLPYKEGSVTRVDSFMSLPYKLRTMEERKRQREESTKRWEAWEEGFFHLMEFFEPELQNTVQEVEEPWSFVTSTGETSWKLGLIFSKTTLEMQMSIDARAISDVDITGFVNMKRKREVRQVKTSTRRELEALWEEGDEDIFSLGWLFE